MAWQFELAEWTLPKNRPTTLDVQQKKLKQKKNNLNIYGGTWNQNHITIKIQK